jgi:hypothetical protein
MNRNIWASFEKSRFTFLDENTTDVFATQPFSNSIRAFAIWRLFKTETPLA